MNGLPILMLAAVLAIGVQPTTTGSPAANSVTMAARAGCKGDATAIAAQSRPTDHTGSRSYAGCSNRQVKWIDPAWPGRTSPLSSSFAQMFAGIGMVTCHRPGGPYRTQMTVVGDRSTIVGAGHFLGETGEPTACIFELFRADGTPFFSSSLASATTALPKEAYSKVRPSHLMDWAVARLVTPVPQEIEPIRVARARPSDLAGARNVFLIITRRNPYTGTVTKEVTSHLALNPVSFSDEHFTHDGNTLPTNSGALILVVKENRPVSFGFHVGALDDANLNLAQFFVPAQLALIPESK